MKITGELLKAERIKKDLSVQDVAYALKLSARIIQSIEAGEINELPAKTFVRGFVKSYADYLKIDSAAVLKQFQEEMGSTHPVPKNPPPNGAQSGSVDGQKTFQNQSSKNIFRDNVESIHGTKIEGGLTQKNIFYFAMVTGLVIVIAIINKVANHYQNEIPQVANLEAKQEATTADVAALPATVSGPSIVANGSVPTTELGVTPSVASAAMTNGVEIAEPSKIQKSEPALSAVDTTPALEKSKGQAVEILIEAKKDSFIDYAKGNTTDFKRVVLKANTYQILKSTSGLHIRATDGSAVNITVNGINKGPMSNSNKTVEMTF